MIGTKDFTSFFYFASARLNASTFTHSLHFPVALSVNTVQRAGQNSLIKNITYIKVKKCLQIAVWNKDVSLTISLGMLFSVMEKDKSQCFNHVCVIARQTQPKHYTLSNILVLLTCKSYYIRGLSKLADSEQREYKPGVHCSQHCYKILVKFLHCGAAVKRSMHCTS